MASNRKPKVDRPPAEQLLNQFLQENGILIGLGEPPVSKTNDGVVIVGKPNIIAVYQENAPKKKAN